MLSLWTLDLTTEYLTWEPHVIKLFSRWAQLSANYSEIIWTAKVSLKSILLSWLEVFLKVVLKSSDLNISVKMPVLLNPHNFTSKWLLWVICKESLKSVQFSELRTLSLTDTWLNLLVLISRWKSKSTILKFLMLLETLSTVFSTVFPHNMLIYLKLLMSNIHLSHSNSQKKFSSLLMRKVSKC